MSNQTIGDAVIALIRTLVPTLVGYLLALAAQAGIGLPSGTSALLDLLFTGVCTAAYYTIVRTLQTRLPWTGWLLGYPVTPSYEHAKHAAN